MKKVTKQGTTLVREIKAGMARKAWTKNELAIRMDMSIDQINRRFQIPESIKFGELVRFQDILKIDLLSDIFERSKK